MMSMQQDSMTEHSSEGTTPTRLSASEAEHDYIRHRRRPRTFKGRIKRIWKNPRAKQWIITLVSVLVSTLITYYLVSHFTGE